MRNQHNLARKGFALPCRAPPRPQPRGARLGPFVHALSSAHPIIGPQARTSFSGGRGGIAVLGPGEGLALWLVQLVALGLRSLGSVRPL